MSTRHRTKKLRVVTDELVESTAQLIQREVWQLFLTLTTKEVVGPEIWRKRYAALVRLVERSPAGLDLGPRPLWRPTERLRHVVAYEPQRRGAIHAHALWSAPELRRVRRRWIAAAWNRLCAPKLEIIEEEDSGVVWLVTPDSEPRGKREFAIRGIAQVVPVGSQEAVAGYCSKYVAKGGLVEVSGL